MYIRKWLDKKGPEFVECEPMGIRIGSYWESVYIDTYVHSNKDKVDVVRKLRVLVNALATHLNYIESTPPKNIEDKKK